MSDFYVFSESGEPVREPNLFAWARFLRTNRAIIQTDLAGAVVSTVFLGMDHNFGKEGPPVLWETMVFGGRFDGECDRYVSRDEAMAGHWAMVVCVQGAP